jgi:hypothetical protein
MFSVLVSSVLSAEESPEAFFDNYTSLGNAFDPSVTELYDDSAQILSYRVYPHGLERNMELSGVQWKELIKRVMPMAEAQNDRSTYSNVVISEIEGGFKVKADRYAEKKCYTDTGYYMIIKPDKDGKLAIFKEYIETRPMPDC